MQLCEGHFRGDINPIKRPDLSYSDRLARHVAPAVHSVRACFDEHSLNVVAPRKPVRKENQKTASEIEPFAVATALYNTHFTFSGRTLLLWYDFLVKRFLC